MSGDPTGLPDAYDIRDEHNDEYVDELLRAQATGAHLCANCGAACTDQAPALVVCTRCGTLAVPTRVP